VSDMSFPLAAAIVRWCELLALVIVIGGFALDILVLPPAEELAAARRRLRIWGTFGVAVLVVSACAVLVMRTLAMSGGGLAGLRAVLPIVLTRTHFGAIWVVRAVALGLLLIVSFAGGRPLRIAGLLLSLCIALTTSLTGHAGDWGDRSLAVLADWIHAVAAGTWIGGLFGLVLAVFPDRARWPASLLGRTAQRFSRLAGYCLLAVVATGAYNVWIQVPGPSALWTTTYGEALIVKLVLAAALAFIGCSNRYMVLPHIVGGGSREPRWLSRLSTIRPRSDQKAASTRLARYVAYEAAIAVVVLGCTAVLGESTPKGHDHHVLGAADLGIVAGPAGPTRRN
jgi:copper resistance protein D